MHYGHTRITFAHASYSSGQRRKDCRSLRLWPANGLTIKQHSLGSSPMHKDANDIEFHHELVPYPDQKEMADMYTKLFRITHSIDRFCVPNIHLGRSFKNIGLSQINPALVSCLHFPSLCISTTSSSCRCCKSISASPIFYVDQVLILPIQAFSDTYAWS